MLTTTALALICTSWIDWTGDNPQPETCYAYDENYHFVYNVDGCNIHQYWLARVGHEVLHITTTSKSCASPSSSGSSRAPDRDTHPDTPDSTTGDGGFNSNGKPRGDNSDANGKGGNKHDRDDFTHGGTETAEDKK